MFPTVREVMALDSMRVGAPRLVAGEIGLDRPVRWVHSAEVPDIATLLRGGELVLTTGIGLPTDDAGIRAFVSDLAEVPVSGLVVELGRRYTGSVPRVMVAAAQKLGLPLIELRRPTPFVRITEAVHALIVAAQLHELQATEEIHQRFTELSVEGASTAEVVREAAALAECPVVLENLARQVLAYDAAGDRAELLLDAWEQHSRRVRVATRTGYDADTGWLVTMVGAQGQDWGRLLLRWPASPSVDTTAADPGGRASERPDDQAAPPTRLIILVERAASTLALSRLIRRDAEGLERQLHGTLLSGVLDRSLSVDEVSLRARALGIALERRRLVGVVVRPRAQEPPAGTEAAQARLRDLAEAASQALREAALTGLISTIDDHAVGALIALRPGGDDDVALAEFATALRRLWPAQAAPPNPPHGHGPTAPPGTGSVRGALVGSAQGAGQPQASRVAGGSRDSVADDLVVAAGSGVDGVREARRSLVEARQVAEAAMHDRSQTVVHRLPNVGLAGLLFLLRDEPRLQTFVERQLGPLLAHDAAHPRDALLGTLRVYLDAGRNKSIAAGLAHLSRPAFYERLARIGRILDVDLDSVPACLSLHVALLAWDALRG